MDRVSWLTQSLKRFDRRLYCDKNEEGKLCIYRTSTRWESYFLDDGNVLTVARSAPFFVTALTHNWHINGKSVEWGYLPIVQRLREIDCQSRDLAEEVIRQQEERDKSRARHERNLLEDGLRERHSKIKKAFSDVNTSTMEKVDRRRRKTKWQL